MAEDYSNEKKYTYNVLVELLTKQGARIGAFSQNVYNKYHRVVGGDDLTKGYCEGVTLDWIRRVLQSQPTRDARFLTYHHAEIQAGADSVGKHPFAEATKRAASTVFRMGTAYSIGTGWLRDTDTGVAELNQRRWGETMQTLDALNPKKKKTFAKMTIEANKSAPYTTTSAWRAVLLGGNGSTSVIPPGNAAQITFEGPKGNRHSVAIWRRRDNLEQSDSFYFFDPNHGVFSYAKAGLNVVLCILFGYTPGGGIPKYKNNASLDWTLVDYVVLGPANRIDAVVSPASTSSTSEAATVTSTPLRAPSPRGVVAAGTSSSSADT